MMTEITGPTGKTSSPSLVRPASLIVKAYQAGTLEPASADDSAISRSLREG